MAGLLALSGMAIAPTLIASVAVIQYAVPSARLTEALSWNTTGLAIGLALGAAVIGQLIDLAGARGGFLRGGRRRGRAGRQFALHPDPTAGCGAGGLVQRRQVAPQSLRASVGRNPVAVILSRLRVLCRGRGAMSRPAAYAAVLVRTRRPDRRRERRTPRARWLPRSSVGPALVTL